jgi:hypothetical protein
MYVEPYISCLHCSTLIELQALRLKSVLRVDPKAAAFVATNVKESAGAAPRVK